MRLALVLVAVLVGSGCSVLDDPREPAALVEARARWAAAGPASYSMTLTRSCYCPREFSGPFGVTVRDGAVASVTLDGEAVPLERALTIEALFDLVAEAYARDAARVDVIYDLGLGYPTHVSIDYSVQIADEEIAYTVADLEAD